MSRALFLDRDGTLNVRLEGYVTCPDEFRLIDGVAEAMALLASRFDHIFVVTNQQGIGKGLMTDADLEAVHALMVRQIEAAGGRIDRIYHCAALQSAHSFMRKPSIGMALCARRDYRDIELKHSVMVGDTRSDMLFGRRAGMQTVLVGPEVEVARREPHLVDYRYDDLLDYAHSLEATKN